MPRFRCCSYRRSFSRQTFRHDYRDRRPHCNARLFELLSSGVGLRQCGRLLDLDVHAGQKKMAELASSCGHLHDNVSTELPSGRSCVMDEEETYAGASIRPLTMPVAIDRETWFVVATSVGTIRRLVPAGRRRRRQQDADERRYGKRRDQSRQCVREVMQALDRRIEGEFGRHTDEKASHGTIARRVLGDRAVHRTTSGTRIRATHNPLFPINTTLAMSRDNSGRLRPRSWLVGKKAGPLRSQLAIFTAYRNYVRRRFDRDAEVETPAVLLGLLPRNLMPDEVVAWRQDWGRSSVSPLSADGSGTVADWPWPTGRRR